MSMEPDPRPELAAVPDTPTPPTFDERVSAVMFEAAALRDTMPTYLAETVDISPDAFATWVSLAHAGTALLNAAEQLGLHLIAAVVPEAAPSAEAPTGGGDTPSDTSTEG